MLSNSGALLIRRAISLLLIFALLASQMASLMPHSHAGMSPEERASHDAVPHIHIGRHAHTQLRHSHGHQDRFHRHRHCCSTHHHDSNPQHDHDDNAIFIDCEFAVVGINQQQKSRCVTTEFQLQRICCRDWQLAPQRLANGLVFERPPDKVIDGSQIYLTTLKLRL